MLSLVFLQYEGHRSHGGIPRRQTMSLIYILERQIHLQKTRLKAGKMNREAVGQETNKPSAFFTA